MIRGELYALVWNTALRRLAVRFGLSDVGLRKICTRHGIPTPPLGYWAKLAHGKRVHRPPLGESTNASVVVTELTEPQIRRRLARGAGCLTLAKGAAIAPEHRITVPAQRPQQLHRLALAAEKELVRAKPDADGFVTSANGDLPRLQIGRGSIERAIIILDTLLKAILARGYALERTNNGLRVKVDGEPLAFRIYATKDKTAYTPTAADLKRQAERDDWARRYPTVYSRNYKVYPAWTYVSSPRLALEVTDPTICSWRGQPVIGRWYDRRTGKLEDHLSEALGVLPAAAAAASRRRAEAAEQARLEALERERRERKLAQIERAEKRLAFLQRKSRDFAHLRRLQALAVFLQRLAVVGGREPIDRVAADLGLIIQEAEDGFAREALNAEIVSAALLADDDPV